MLTQDKQLAVIRAMAKKCQNRRFWGELVFTFRGGDLKMTSTKETLPPEKVFDYERTPIAIAKIKEVEDGDKEVCSSEEAKESNNQGWQDESKVSQEA